MKSRQARVWPSVCGGRPYPDTVGSRPSSSVGWPHISTPIGRPGACCAAAVPAQTAATSSADVFPRIAYRQATLSTRGSRMVLFVTELRPDSCVVAEVRESPNHNERTADVKADILELHYTGTLIDEGEAQRL